MIFNITVYFDTTCPWCFIGHRALDQAIALYQRTYPEGRHDTFSFQHHPYFLKPDASGPGVTMLEAIATKNGAERVDAITKRLQRAGQAHGIRFDFNGKTGNTRLSHQLIRRAGLAYGADMEKQLVNNLYAMHFEQGGDITSPEDLEKTAMVTSIMESEAREWLADAKAGEEVDRSAREARASGVAAVPTLDINGVRIEGAEEVGLLYQALVEVKETVSVD